MKKLIIVPILLFFLQGHSQHIDTLIGVVNGHPGKPIFDTALTIATNYIITPTPTSIAFDSTKVIVSVTKNATRDSFQFKNGAGVIIATLKDSAGSGGGSSLPDMTGQAGKILTNNGSVASWGTAVPGIWSVDGVNVYYSAGDVEIRNDTVATSGKTYNTPSLWLYSQAWNATAGASQPAGWRIYSSSGLGNPVSSTLIFQPTANGADFGTPPFKITSGGTLTLTGLAVAQTINATNAGINVQGGTAGYTFNNNWAWSNAWGNKQMFAVTGSYNSASGSATTVGFYYAPTLVGITGSTIIAFQNTVGNSFFNTVSGGTSIGATTTLPSSRIFQVVSTTQAASPFPVMTAAQKTAIASPQIGDHIYQSDGTEGVYVYKSSGWVFGY